MSYTRLLRVRGWSKVGRNDSWLCRVTSPSSRSMIRTLLPSRGHCFCLSGGVVKTAHEGTVTIHLNITLLATITLLQFGVISLSFSRHDYLLFIYRTAYGIKHLLRIVAHIADKPTVSYFHRRTWEPVILLDTRSLPFFPTGSRRSPYLKILYHPSRHSEYHVDIDMVEAAPGNESNPLTINKHFLSLPIALFATPNPIIQLPPSKATFCCRWNTLLDTQRDTQRSTWTVTWRLHQLV